VIGTQCCQMIRNDCLYELFRRCRRAEGVGRPEVYIYPCPPSSTVGRTLTAEEKCLNFLGCQGRQICYGNCRSVRTTLSFPIPAIKPASETSKKDVPSHDLLRSISFHSLQWEIMLPFWKLKPVPNSYRQLAFDA
jgi:hypothetical protein